MPLKPINLKPRLEEVKKDPGDAARYAAKVLHHRWPEAEPYILKDPYHAYYYALNVVKERWPEFEEVLLSNPNTHFTYLIGYAANNVKGRWPEAEARLSTIGRNRYRTVLKGLHGIE
jgi:hypothetical protein